MFEYITKIWESRYFWVHLALSDLRTKFRRSKLGILWAIINPLLLTLLLSFLMGSLFKHPLGPYALYVFSGLIVWNLLLESAVTGCYALINSEGYMKQIKHPIAIYPLRSVLVSFIVFCLGFLGLLGWAMLAKFENFNVSLISLLLAFPLYFFIACALCIITSMLNVKFRDFAQMVTLIFQVLWYLSPVFIDENVFINGHLGFLVYYNPIFHLLNLIRSPILNGVLPSATDYIYVFGLLAILWFIAIVYLNRNEKKLIFIL